MSSDSTTPSTSKDKLIIVTAPSGAGKTTIVRNLLEMFNELAFSVSATTREKRPKEKEGRDYYFMTKEAFEALINADAFAESEEVYAGQMYGTLKREIEKLSLANKCPIFDIDVNGALELKKKYPHALSIFIKPPSTKTLRKRLLKRKTESEESLQKRIKKAEFELSFASKFDTFILNDDLDCALLDAKQIVQNYLSRSS